MIERYFFFQNVPLDDDTVLNRIQLSNEEEREEISLSPIEQALILGLWSV